MTIAKGFKEEELTADQIRHLRNVSRQVRGDVLRMTRIAGGGHLGGSLSSADIYATLFAAANLRPDQVEDIKRDRVVVSHGHTAPSLYAALGRYDFFDLDDAVGLFRKAGSIFEGSPERTVPGVEWTPGGLGQGLAAASGLALAGRLRGLKYNVFVVMSDGEQQKGQVAEARRFAKKYRLNNITAIVDCNGMQGVGRVADVMPQNVKYDYIADGWDVIEINGHDHNELYKALRRAIQIQSAPVLILAQTVFGAGVSFMEGEAEYHSRGPTEEEYREAMAELRLDDDLAELEDYREAFGDFDLDLVEETAVVPIPDVGSSPTYGARELLPNSAAFARALAEVGARNQETSQVPLAVLDCALAPVVGTDRFAREQRDSYFQFGVQEHAAATTAGTLSAEGVVTVWAGIGSFSLDGTYDQLRINDLNRSHVKLVLTHLGLDAGNVGKGGQCTDYLGLLDNLYGVKAVFPADPNQTDRVFRHMLGEPGTWVMGLGQSPAPVILNEKGKPYFGGDYRFEYGRVDLLRPGDHGVILTTGQMLGRAIEAWEALRDKQMEPSVIHVACPKVVDQIDDPVFLQSLRKGRVITYEDHNVRTGLGARVANCIAERGISCRLLKLGVACYGMSGAPDEVYRKMGLDVQTLVAKALKFLKR